MQYSPPEWRGDRAILLDQPEALMIGGTPTVEAARATGFQALRNILPLIAYRSSLVNNTSTANKQ
jgi:hypothetical protein